jgi:hypothetical protein
MVEVPVTAPVLLAYPLEPCKRCGRLFAKNRKDKLYCSLQCQDPSRVKGLANAELGRKERGLVRAFNECRSMGELTSEFQTLTGVPYTIRLEHMPRRRSFKLPAEMAWEDMPHKGFWGREEQGRLYWNVPGREPLDNELEPADVERALRDRVPEVRHQGQTVDEWLAAGGQVRVLPPGKAIAI